MKGFEFDDLSLRYTESPFSVRIPEREIEKLFKPFGIKPWAAQRLWARRFLRGESFCLLGPTGSGKTTAILAFSLLKKSLIIVPTSTLAYQLAEKLRSIGVEPSEHHSLGKHTESDRILITTSASLSRNPSLIEGFSGEAVFVDDVDGFLRRSKAIYAAMDYLGLRDVFEDVMRCIKEKKEWTGNVSGQLIVSGATHEARRTLRILALRRMFGFDVGRRIYTYSNILHLFSRNDMLGIIKRLGSGGIVYTPSEKIEATVELLRKEGFVVEGYTRASKKIFTAFENGEIDILVGTVSRRSSLVRGIDLPERVKYVVFSEIPKIRLTYTTEKKIEVALRRAYRFLEGDERKKCAELIGRPEEGKEFLEKLSERPEMRRYGFFSDCLVVPDTIAYLQACGRTSRLTAGGMTRGVSIVMVDDENLFSSFREALEIAGIEFKPVEDVDLEKEISKRDEKLDIEFRTKLVVVESPTKARVISGFFGSSMKRDVNGVNAFESASPGRFIITFPTKGHFTDLDVTSEGYGALLNGKVVARYVPIKPEIIKALGILAGDVDEVVVATDPDSEGEKIAWDVRFYSSHPVTKRVRFHEITRKTVVPGIEGDDGFDEGLLKSQVVRRIEDAWIGLRLSEIVQKLFGPGLSAGRVQTPVLGWIKERTQESRKKVELITLKLKNGLTFVFKAPRGTAKKINEVEIVSVEREKKKIHPQPPYTTDTVLSEASRRLSVSTERIMQLLQDLFECGLITYHRTDSTRVSSAGIEVAKRFLEQRGMNIVPRTWGEGGAHECIRPTRPSDPGTVADNIRIFRIPVRLSKEHFTLYSLIFYRFIKSQMEPAVIEETTVKARVNGMEIERRFVNAVEKAGWSVFGGIRTEKYDVSEGKYPVDVKFRLVSEKPLFTESEIIRLMKEKGIGRPSTYAVTVEKLKKRRYVFPIGTRLKTTSLGEKVHSFLVERYPGLVSEERTKTVLREMDEVESGKRSIKEILSNLKKELPV
ncbi:MAG: reverse gyrase [Candidatus Micrarchaeota archaeon]|nr:reverse gyrase [Candidatus Micrarchaeota archaeon]